MLHCCDARMSRHRARLPIVPINRSPCMGSHAVMLAAIKCSNRSPCMGSHTVMLAAIKCSNSPCMGSHAVMLAAIKSVECFPESEFGALVDEIKGFAVVATIHQVKLGHSCRGVAARVISWAPAAGRY